MPSLAPNNETYNKEKEDKILNADNFLLVVN